MKYYIVMSKDTEKEYLFKIVIVGDGDVGKSSILSRMKSEEIRLPATIALGVEVHKITSYIDNNTIRLSADNVVFAFALTDISNNIPEPTFSGTEYFVDGSVGSSGDGLTEANAFKTIQEGVDEAIAGDKVWIKAFDYGNVSVASVINGAVGSPIWYEGYKTSNAGTPIPITSNYYQA